MHLCFIVNLIVRQLTVTVKIAITLCFKQFVVVFDELLSNLMCFNSYIGVKVDLYIMPSMISCL